MKRVLALALCRVSSIEQLENNSLNRQRNSVIRAAHKLNVIIPEDGWWSGSVSSKKGRNIDRKDLQEMLERCKRDRRIKYIIVDEVDRFMRSMLEIGYYVMEFSRLNVEIIFASQPDLKTDTATDTLMLMLEAFKAEGSNEERQRKSINGQTNALTEGRYTFSPKPGYMKGKQRGIPDLHPVRGPALRKIFLDIVYKRTTPTQGLVNLNKSRFMDDGHSKYRMDKFRKIAIDPFYAGIIEMNKQVKVRNENGLHEPLLSKEEHNEIVRIFENKKKTQKGPRKNGNPNFPLSNIVSCKECINEPNGRIVGFKHSNGKKNGSVYEKYRCRSCKKYITKKDLHYQIENQFKIRIVTDEGLEAIVEALNIVWKQEEVQKEKEIIELKTQIKVIRKSIDRQVEALSDPKNFSLQDEIRQSIQNKKDQVNTLEGKSSKYKLNQDNNKEQFLRFAFDFIENIGNKFLDTAIVSKENRLRCKQIIFPAGFFIDENKKVYTPEVSVLYRLVTKKKGILAPSIPHLVRVRGL